MNKCLVTKLNGICNNPDLIKLDELVITLNATKVGAWLCITTTDNDSASISVKFNKTVNYSTGNSSEEATDRTDITETTIAPGIIPFFFAKETGTIKVSISSKFNIASLLTSSTTASGMEIVDVKGFSYLSNLKTIENKDGNLNIDTLSGFKNLSKVILGKGEGLLKSFVSCPLKELVLINSGIVGTLSDLVNISTLTSLNFMDSKSITGNISDLRTLTSLTSLSVVGTNITGTIESLADGMKNAGRKSGKLTVYSSNTEGITYNGAVFDYIVITFSDGSYSVEKH